MNAALRKNKRPVNRGRLIIKADDAFSLYIRERDGYVCFTCGLKGQPKDGVMQCRTPDFPAVLLYQVDELNAHCQCRGCNYRHEYDYEVYRAAFVHRYGEEDTGAFTRVKEDCEDQQFRA
jgi:hypothetical protein